MVVGPLWMMSPAEMFLQSVMVGNPTGKVMAAAPGMVRNEMAIDLGTPQEVRLRVDDDGVGQVHRSGHGLGSTFLDECTSEWSSESTDEGHVLEARLPVESKALTG